MSKMKIKKGDKVIVIAGDDKGKTGEVLRAMPKLGKVIVQGVNLVKRHTKPSQTTPGGIVTKEAPINVSNVALVDPKTGKAVANKEENKEQVKPEEQVNTKVPSEAEAAQSTIERVVAKTATKPAAAKSVKTAQSSEANTVTTKTAAAKAKTATTTSGQSAAKAAAAAKLAADAVQRD